MTVLDTMNLGLWTKVHNITYFILINNACINIYVQCDDLMHILYSTDKIRVINVFMTSIT